MRLELRKLENNTILAELKKGKKTYDAVGNIPRTRKDFATLIKYAKQNNYKIILKGF